MDFHIFETIYHYIDKQPDTIAIKIRLQNSSACDLVCREENSFAFDIARIVRDIKRQ